MITTITIGISLAVLVTLGVVALLIRAVLRWVGRGSQEKVLDLWGGDAAGEDAEKGEVQP